MRARRWVTLLGGLGLLFALLIGRAGAEPESASAQLETATFAAGCYWCVEKDFDKVEGVVETISGFTGGQAANPTYEQVGQGGTGHTEALLVRFDPKRVSYQQLLDYYWRHVDFLDGDGQFCDRGDQYRPAIFTHSPEQRQLAEASKGALQSTVKEPVAVEIADAQVFYPAKEEHQGYYEKHPIKYKFYRYNCGRDQRTAEIWDKIGSAAGH
jgi:methionine-S-sulfoxide reductase